MRKENLIELSAQLRKGCMSLLIKGAGDLNIVNGVTALKASLDDCDNILFLQEVEDYSGVEKVLLRVKAALRYID